MNDVLWLANLVFNGFDVRPTYVWSGVLLFVDTVARYTRDFLRHLPGKGHLSGDLQLQPLSNWVLL